MYEYKKLKDNFHLRKIINFAKSGLSNKPWYLIFAITAQCNQQCVMCFYWENIKNYDESKELTLDEIRLITPQFDNLYQLTLSGGEPLLRKDCLEIVKTFANYTPVQRITLTSNGSMPKRIEKFVRGFCSSYPDINLSVNLPVDGLEKTHEKIRGVPGSFKKVLESFDLLGRLKKEYKNVDRATATTVSSENQDEIFRLLDFIESRLDISNHGLMLARGSMQDESLAFVSVKKFKDMACSLEKRRKKKVGIVNRSVFGIYQDRRIKSLDGRKMLDPCLAGRKLLILNEKGVLTPCELLEDLRVKNKLNYPFDGDFIFGNLRDQDYNINNILDTPKAKKIKEFIRKNGCWCSFECAMINNFILNPINYAKIARKTFIEYLIK